MAVIPTSIETLPLQHLRDLVAATAAFQTWVGAINAAAAAESIHYVTVDGDDLSSLRPYAIVGFEPDEGMAAERASITSFDRSGQLVLYFEDAVSTDDTEAERLLKFANNTGAVLAAMEALAGGPRTGGSYLRMRGWTRMFGPLLNDENERATQGLFAAALYVIEYDD